VRTKLITHSISSLQAVSEGSAWTRPLSGHDLTVAMSEGPSTSELKSAVPPCLVAAARLHCIASALQCATDAASSTGGNAYADPCNLAKDCSRVVQSATSAVAAISPWFNAASRCKYIGFQCRSASQTTALYALEVAGFAVLLGCARLMRSLAALRDALDAMESEAIIDGSSMKWLRVARASLSSSLGPS